jgi:hypothetical protein
MLKKDKRNAQERQYDKRYGVKWGSADDHYESDMQGIITLADAIKNMAALSSLDLTSNGPIRADTLVAVSQALKRHVIEHHQACHLIGHALMTRDLRALLVATYTLNPRCWLPAIGTVHLCKEIALWL